MSLCAIHWATGLPCPGCGLTRSILALFHGDVERAFYFYPIWPLFILLIIFRKKPAMGKIFLLAMFVQWVFLLLYFPIPK